MSEIATIRPNQGVQSTATSNADVIRVLRNSLYPGAKPESVELVLAWCRANGRDPMRKPIHIVPMNIKDALTGKWGWQDTLMPGIGTYRTDAARTGQYAGKSEPEFGPDVTRDFDGCKVTFPAWCRVTVRRTLNGTICEYSAKEMWVENYATGKEGRGVNAMWQKRPYGQLAKCAESQALRMAFPEETGNSYTAEEMEGKGFEGTTIDAEPDRQTPASQSKPTNQTTEIPALETPAPVDKMAAATDRLVSQINACQDEDALHVIASRQDISDWRTKLSKSRPELEARIAAAYGDRYAALVGRQDDTDIAETADEVNDASEPDDLEEKAE